MRDYQKEPELLRERIARRQIQDSADCERQYETLIRKKAELRKADPVLAEKLLQTEQNLRTLQKEQNELVRKA